MNHIRKKLKLLKGLILKILSKKKEQAAGTGRISDK